jgi:hypothetical protein
VGTPDANGAPAKFVGSLLFTVVRGDPSTTANEADVQVTAALTDVRCLSALPSDGSQPSPCLSDLGDYTGALKVSPTVRITDRRNGFRDDRPATLQNLDFPFSIACTATASDTVGSTCGAATTFNAIAPGAVVEGKRAIWAFEHVVVNDTSTPDDLPFVTQGVFVP